MTNLLKISLLLLATFCCHLSLIAQAPPFPEVVSIRKIVLKPDANPISFHNDIQMLSGKLKQFGMGIDVMLFSGDRGQRKGELLHAWTFELKENREYYFPTADAQDYTRLAALIEVIGMEVSASDPRVESGLEVYTDYVVLGYDKINYPRNGSVFAVRELETKPGQEAAFEAFVADTYHPTMQQVKFGVSYVLKGDRGERAGKYLLVDCFPSLVERNAIYPEEGQGVSDEVQAAMSEIIETLTKMQSFLKEGSGDIYTDYLLVR